MGKYKWIERLKKRIDFLKINDSPRSRIIVEELQDILEGKKYD